jgi:hypothetical protein
MLWRPLKREIFRNAGFLFDRGYEFVTGADQGFFGEGCYELAAITRRVRVRVYRSRVEEFVDFSIEPRPVEAQWFDVGYSQLLFGAQSLNEYSALPLRVAVKLEILAANIERLENLARLEEKALRRQLEHLRAKGFRSWYAERRLERAERRR